MKILIWTVLLIIGESIFDIKDFGALPHQDHVSAQFVNQKAFLKAVQQANSTTTQQRVIRVPRGTFYFMPLALQNLSNISIIIQGRMSASKSISQWPTFDEKHYLPFISCTNCTKIEISGGGKIDGRGYHWWLVCILNDKKYLDNQNNRPHLIYLTRTSNFRIHDITLKNSGQFHIKMADCSDGEFYNINIKVNVTAQFNLMKKFSVQGIIPLFPLNTDGIDPHGKNMHFYNLTVLNYDDVVVPKPSNNGSQVSNCTENILIENCTVVLGVGMSVGSVPPNDGCNCIRNIIFRNIQFQRPLKAIYVKTNPGDSGTGLVENILYSNITMDRPIWWAIYIGPQQMKEPDGDGPGCMLYPFDPHGTCTTQPRVSLRNITLRDVKIHNSLLYPITIRCNVTNPCSDINFYSVKTDKWRIGQKQKGYVCEYSSGTGQNNYPHLDCIKDQNKQQFKIQNLHKEQLSQIISLKENSRQILLELQEAIIQANYSDDQNDEFTYDLQFEENQAFRKFVQNQMRQS